MAADGGTPATDWQSAAAAAAAGPGASHGDSAKAAIDARAEQVMPPATELPMVTSASRHGVGEAQDTGIGSAAPMVSPSGNSAVESTATSAPTVRHEILTGFGQRGWDQAISQRVLWLAQDQLQQASLTLNPPHLGPIQVTVQIENQQAMVQFVSAQPEVRQALQDSIPVLREMFGQAGIELGQTDIGSRNPERGTRQPDPSAPPAQAGDGDLSLEELATSLPLLARGQGLINLFA
jgi:flagellar hook-length control protein FliK